MEEKIAILGAGNLGVAIAVGAVKSSLLHSRQLILTRRNLDKLHGLASDGYQLTSNNPDAVQQSKIVILCVQPKQVANVVKEIAPVLLEDKHILVSTVTGVSLEEIAQHLGNKNIPVVRAMPNTAIAIGSSMTCIATQNATNQQLHEVVKLFDHLGETLIVEERLMKASTVLAASGIAFFMRYLRAATQGGIQLGFDAEDAQAIAVQTAKGAALLLQKNGSHPEMEIDKVTTPEGCTIAGLNEMEHQGLSSALIKGILTSFDKINNIRK
jgi:pyrroline-5-carboxylate reductase